MEKYLIALDLDGTLLYDFDSVSKDLAEFMKEIQKDGHKIVIATGRPYRSSSFVYDLFELDTPIINYNGGLITHPKKKDFPIVNYTVAKEDIIDIFENNIDHIRNAFSEVKDTIYLYKEEKEIEPLLHRMSTSPVYLGHLKDTLKEDPNGFIIIGKQGEGREIEKYVNDHFDGRVLSRIWDLKGEFDSIVEIFTPESNKGKGLKYVADYLNIPQERVIALGDGHNDIEMLQYASLGVAVKNAHPDLIEVADLILDETSKEDAVRKFLKRYLKK